MNTIRRVDGVWRCVLCGDASPDQDHPHLGECQCDRGEPRGLGDMVADTLASVGVTKDRAQAVANAFGVADCGCAKRQAALNKIGRAIGIGTRPPASKAGNG